MCDVCVFVCVWNVALCVCLCVCVCVWCVPAWCVIARVCVFFVFDDFLCFRGVLVCCM